ncbi:MAG TPA: hypothetical protein PKH51_05200, partial [Candidatus Sumerlaeota bacterium]|nr:hypothetical protein [Candidatus Sumerlaeota bacterium]
MKLRLRDNPLIRYYALFGANARRRRLVIALLLLYTTLITTIAYSLVGSPNPPIGGDQWMFVLLLSTPAYAFIAPACFFFFAPKLRSPEILEEFLLTRMSKREVVVGYCLPPLALFACVVLITFVILTVVPYLITGQMHREYRVAAVAHLAGAVVAAAVALRVWTAHPGSTLRTWFQTPLMALLCGAIALIMGIMMDAFASSMNLMHAVRDLDDVMACFGFVIGALLPVVQAKRFCSLRFFRGVDPEPYQIACWIGNELAPSRKRPEIGATFRRLLALVAHDSRYVVLALVATVLVCLPVGIMAFSRADTFSTSAGPWLWSLNFLTRGTTVIATSVIFAILYLFFRSFARKDRAFVLLAGGIIPSVLLSLIPVFVATILYVGIACIAQRLALRARPDPVAVMICYTALSFLSIAAFTMYALPRPRSGLYGLLGIIGFLLLLFLSAKYFEEAIYAAWRVFSLGLSALALVAIISAAWALRRKPRRRAVPNFGAIFTVLFILLPFLLLLLHDRNFFRNSEFVIVGTFFATGFFLTFGFDTLAQRIHRLELANLE